MKIWLWEPDPLSRESIALFLKARHQVQRVEHYRGLRKALKQHEDRISILIVNRETLNKLSYIGALQKLNPLVGVVVLLSHQSQEEQLEVLSQADRVLMLPFSLEHLEAECLALRRLLQRASRFHSPSRGDMQHGDYVFDHASGRVQGPEGEYDPGQRAFLLWEYLSRHPEKIFTRQHLYRVVWAGKTSAHGRQIDNLVVQLRHLLPDSVRIESVYGKGYRLIIEPSA